MNLTLLTFGWDLDIIEAGVRFRFVDTYWDRFYHKKIFLVTWKTRNVVSAVDIAEDNPAMAQSTTYGWLPQYLDRMVDEGQVEIVKPWW